MDDDSPDDVALRTLARQLFADHGARPRHRRRARHRAVDHRRRHPRVLRRALPHRATTVVASPATSTTTTSWPRSRRRSPTCPTGDGRVARAAPGGVGEQRRASTTTPSRSTSPSAAARCAATTPTARRSTSSTTSSAAGCRAACSTRSASGAASPTACTRRRRPTPTPAPGRCTPGRCPSTPARSRRLIGDELDRLVADGITDDELAIAVGYLTGAYEMGLEDTGARMSRLGGHAGHARRGASRSTSRSPAGSAVDARRRAPRASSASTAPAARRRLRRPQSLTLTIADIARRSRVNAPDGVRECP